jgi:hypothetical protein
VRNPRKLVPSLGLQRAIVINHLGAGAACDHRRSALISGRSTAQSMIEVDVIIFLRLQEQ